MKPEGRTRIDAFAAELNGSYARVDAIRVIGHTDRLGSAEYNGELSSARANTVAQMLVARGVERNLIQSIGVGSTQPVAKCNGSTAGRALIECLAPNRRVEIVVEGVRR